MTVYRTTLIACIILGGFLITCDCCAEAASRKLSPSDPMPQFSIVDNEGVEISYTPADETALLVVFYSPEKQQSMNAMKDIEEIMGSFGKMPHKLSYLAVSDDPNSTSPIKSNNIDQLTTHFIKDTDYKLWGMFGVIASPTVFLAGTDGKIELIKAGHGYDFAPTVKSKLLAVMGLISEKEADEAGQAVKTVTNASTEEKANRHLKMAQMLKDRGNYAGALSQLETAVQIDPNSTECSLELAEMYCIVSDPNKAIDVVEKLRPIDKTSQARRALVLGGAYSQLKDYTKAEKYFLETIESDPKNSRVYYELGKLYQAQNQSEKALDLYRKSLDLVYGKKE